MHLYETMPPFWVDLFMLFVDSRLRNWEFLINYHAIEVLLDKLQLCLLHSSTFHLVSILFYSNSHGQQKIRENFV